MAIFIWPLSLSGGVSSTLCQRNRPELAQRFEDARFQRGVEGERRLQLQVSQDLLRRVTLAASDIDLANDGRRPLVRDLHQQHGRFGRRIRIDRQSELGK